MKKLLFLVIVLLGFVIWPLTTRAGQPAVLRLTPTPPCSTVTPMPSPTYTPTAVPRSLMVEAPTAVPAIPLSPQEGRVMTTTTPTPTLPPCIPLPPCPILPTVGPLTPTYTPTPTSSPCATVTPTPATPTETPCAATPTPTPLQITPTPTPFGTTPTAVPCTTISTPTPTTMPIFSAIVNVIPSETWLEVGETLLVNVTLEVTQGCQFPILELTLSQETDGKPPFEPSEPIVLGPGVSMPATITLTAVTTGTTTFQATLFGESNCGQGWVWTYAYGQSVPVAVGDTPPPTPTAQPSATPVVVQNPQYLPMLRRD